MTRRRKPDIGAFLFVRRIGPEGGGSGPILSGEVLILHLPRMVERVEGRVSDEERQRPRLHIWAALFGASLFAFFHILIGPTSGYLSQFSYQGWLAAMGVFAAFGAFTVLFWAWFRFRPSPAAEGSSQG